jgi:glycosyltransferase involved in cell wall biosynthesis
MRILVVHGRYRSEAPSGENIVVDQETAALRAGGHEVELFERHSDDIAGWSPARKASLPLRTVWSPEAKRYLASRIAATRPDVVHVHNTFPLISASVLYACRDAGVPVVATIHNYRLLCAGGGFFRDGAPCHDCAGGHGLPALRHGCYRGSRAATLPIVAANVVHRSAWQRLVSAYLFISASQQDLMSPLGLPRERVFVKHNFVVAAADQISARREHLVTYVGRLDAAKGVPVLMEAWDTFRAANPLSALRLVVVGGGPLEGAVREWAAGQPSVEHAGLRSREEVGTMLARSLASVVTSVSEETFGLVAVEAMAAGVAPIAPAFGPFPELIDHGRDGVVFPAADARSLAATFADVDADPQRFVSMGRAGRATYERRFQAGASTERLVEIYRFAVAHPVTESAEPVPEPSA